MQRSVRCGMAVCEALVKIEYPAAGLAKNLGGASQIRGYADCGAKEGKKKTMTICQAPPNEPKVIPPYEYGYCREPDPEPPTGCPKKKEEKKSGPCCKSQKKQGCRSG